MGLQVDDLVLAADLLLLALSLQRLDLGGALAVDLFQVLDGPLEDLLEDERVKVRLAHTAICALVRQILDHIVYREVLL